jgi:hypothetical protein
VIQGPNLVEFTTDPRLLGLALSAAQETLLRSIEGPFPSPRSTSTSGGSVRAARPIRAVRSPRRR